MTFLVWDNKIDADASLVNINAMYGCPHTAENGYRMDTWDVVIASVNSDAWGFFKPEERLGMEIGALMSGLVEGYDEVGGRPIEFFPDVEEEVGV